jgi:hypothetical protein
LTASFGGERACVGKLLRGGAYVAAMFQQVCRLSGGVWGVDERRTKAAWTVVGVESDAGG